MKTLFVVVVVVVVSILRLWYYIITKRCDVESLLGMNVGSDTVGMNNISCLLKENFDDVIQ